MCVCLQERKFSISITIQEWSVGVLLKCLKSRSCMSSGRGTREDSSRCSNILGDDLSDNWKNNKCSFFLSENVLQLWCNTLKWGNPVEFTCVSFITMIMVNVSHVLCCFIVSWNKSFKRLGFCLLKVGISLILNWPLSWQMKWDTSTCSFCKVPPFNVLHHNNYFMTS